MLQPVRTVAPATAPVSLAEAKAHMAVEHDDHDDLIDGLIAGAVDHLDGWRGILGLALVTQTWRQDFGKFASALQLPVRPVQSIAGVTYYDGDNAEQTLATSVYELRTDDTRGPYIALQPGEAWPATYSRTDAVSVTFVAGYGGAADVPAAIRVAIMMMVSHWYASREAVVVGTGATTLPLGAEMLLAQYWRPRV